MPKIRLTELNVRNAKPLATQFMLWDATLQNFGVRVSPGGAKNFTIMLGARRERVSIERFACVTATSDTACRIARQALPNPPETEQTNLDPRVAVNAR